MNQTIQQQVVSEYLNKEVSHKTALDVIEKDFAGIVVFLGYRKKLQMNSEDFFSEKYTKSEQRKVLGLYLYNSKTIEQISQFLHLGKAIVKDIISDHTRKKITATSKN